MTIGEKRLLMNNHTVNVFLFAQYYINLYNIYGFIDKIQLNKRANEKDEVIKKS